MNNICKLKLTTLQQEIFSLLLLRSGKKMNQHQIARELGYSQPAVSKALPRLEELELITRSRDKDSGRWEIQADRNNHRVLQLKRIENLRLIYESGLADFLEKNYPGKTLVLFGSYSRGEDTVSSDIDIAVIGEEKTLDHSGYEEILERKINMNFYPSLKSIHVHLKENICNGVVLFGGMEF